MQFVSGHWHEYSWNCCWFSTKSLIIVAYLKTNQIKKSVCSRSSQEWGYIYFRHWKIIIKKSRGHCDAPQKNNGCWSQTLKFRLFAYLVTIRILVWLLIHLHTSHIYSELQGRSNAVRFGSLAWILMKLLLIFHKKSHHCCIPKDQPNKKKCM